MFALKNVSKSYTAKGSAEVVALNDISINFADTGLVFILGKSGSGKSTLLNVIGGLDKPDSGEIIVDGVSSKDFSAQDFDGYRNTHVGFVFQEFNILDDFTVAENIALSLKLQSKPNDKEAVESLLDLVELKDLGNRSPKTLSGGQKQRVAIARALIKDPKIIMADEPTGSLDSKTGKQVFDILKKLSQEKLVIVVSHDREFAFKYGDRIIELADGKIISDVEKVVESGETVFKNVEVVANNTLKIADVSKITEEEVKNIFSKLSSQKGEAIITFDKDNVAKVKTACGIKENEVKKGIATFKPKKKEDIPQPTSHKANFIKSRLPFAHSLKMGVSGFKAKPIRLVFTILLSVIAFCMFGVLSTLMMYRTSYSMAIELQENHYQNILLDKRADYKEQNISVLANGTEVLVKTTEIQKKVLFSTEEIARLNKNEQGLRFAGVFNYSIPNEKINTFEIRESFSKAQFNITAEDSVYFAKKNLIGFSDCGEQMLLDMGYKKKGGKYPTNKNEIAISYYTYQMLKSALGEDEEILNNQDLIVLGYGDNNTQPLTIVGVYEVSDLSRYEVLRKSDVNLRPDDKTTLVQNMKDTIAGSLNLVGFVHPDFYEANLENLSSSKEDPEKPKNAIKVSKIYLGYKEPEADIDIDKVLPVSCYNENIVENYKDYFSFYNLDGTATTYTPNDDAIWLKESTYITLKNEHGIEALEENGYYVLNKEYKQTKIAIAGYYRTSANDFTANGILTTKFLLENSKPTAPQNNWYSYNKVETEYSFPQDQKYNYIITKSNNTTNEVEFMLQDRGNINYGMENNASYKKLFGEGAGSFAEMLSMLKKIFLIAGVVVGVLAALMLFNFISTSIVTKRKEIGILRAVGAGRADVFRIFFTESILLTLICFVIAMCVGFAVAAILDGALFNIYALHLIEYGIKNILLMFAVSIIISFVATIFPVLREAKKSPVESIRQL